MGPRRAITVKISSPEKHKRCGHVFCGKTEGLYSGEKTTTKNLGKLWKIHESLSLIFWRKCSKSLSNILYYRGLICFRLRFEGCWMMLALDSASK